MRILHATDFSQAAERALRLAFDLQARLAAKLHIVHVQERYNEEVSGYLAALRYEPNPALLERLEQVRQEDAQRRLMRLNHLAEGKATTELLWGKPLEALLRIVADYDLVVMGAHGQNPLDAAFLGGVAGRLVRRSPVPVLTVRETCRATQIRRVILATDFGDASKHAWQWLAPWRSAGVEMVLAHVVDDRRLQDDPGYIQTVTEAMTLLSKGAAKQHVVREGDVAEVLPKLADELAADLIAIGLRRHSTVVGLLLGSNADALLRASSVPILSVPYAGAG
jgi:nucleotide-binding universal stress UspA family protein